jgi:hypothetical protein
MVASGLLGAALVFCLERFGLLTGARRAEAPVEPFSVEADTPVESSSADSRSRVDPSSAEVRPPAAPSSVEPRDSAAPSSAAASRGAGGAGGAEENEARELLAMSESYRSTTILGAIRDGGFTCSNMTRIRDAAPGVPAWWVTCEDGLSYWVGVGPDGRLAIDLSPYNDLIGPRVPPSRGDEVSPLVPNPGPERLTPVQPAPGPQPQR